MLACFNKTAKSTTPITLVEKKGLKSWLAKQTAFTKNWVAVNQFTAKPQQLLLVPNAAGKLQQVLLGVESLDDMWAVGGVSARVPSGTYNLATKVTAEQQSALELGWALGAYRFTRYKSKHEPLVVKLRMTQTSHKQVQQTAEAIYTLRDLINTPAEDMGPDSLARAARKIATQFKATCTVTTGDQLLKKNFPSIHAVGRAAARAPRLIELNWGKPSHPKLVLVGKGVCYDTGGLSLKSTAGMLDMKGDMGGAAHAFALAQMIMAAKLPIQLRVLVGAVENSVDGNAYRPGDIVTARNGKTVEITNTDAEGRVVLSDCLVAAAEKKPKLIIDFATLTGAARVALGYEYPALFSNRQKIADKLLQYGRDSQDEMWQLPLHKPYMKYLDSSTADIVNSNSRGMGGAIMAALFLQEFVDDVPWVHLDIMGSNPSARPGRPDGGDATCIRGLFNYLQNEF